MSEKKKRGTAAMDIKTRTAVAKRGGTALYSKYGSDHMREIGKKGGASLKKKMGPDMGTYMAELGTRGGRNTRGKEE